MHSTIAFLGDIHGKMPVLEAMLRQGLQRGCATFIQVGDFWLYDQQDQENLNHILSDLCRTYNVPQEEVSIYFIDGNHEDFSLLDPYSPHPTPITNNLTYLPRGSMITLPINGKEITLGAAGGAVSIDRDYRTSGENWWSIEKPRAYDYAPLTEHVDILVSHDAPTRIRDDLFLEGAWRNTTIEKNILADTDQVAQLLTEVVQKTSPSLLVHGHYHFFRLAQIDDTFTALSLGKETDLGSCVLYDVVEKNLNVVSTKTPEKSREFSLPYDVQKKNPRIFTEDLMLELIRR